MGPARPTRWRAALRAPLLHFLLLGGALFALRPAETPALVVGAAEREALQRDFEAREARPPTAAELEALLEGAIDDEVLLREAVEAGRLRHDGTVVNRLVQLGRFVGPKAEATAPDLALARARDLGLDRSDPVIRRYLLERSRLALAAEADHPEPSEAELQAWRRAHPGRFRTPERLRLTHVFVSRRRPEAETRAADLARTLAGRRPDSTEALGDPFQGGRRLVATREELARGFGPDFARALDASGRGRWQGPLPSAHGLHLVWLDEPLPPRTPALREVRGQVRQALLQERRESHLRQRLDALRSGYAIRVDPGRVD